MPDRRGLLRAALALLLAPAVWTAMVVVAVLMAAHRQGPPVPMHLLAGQVFIDTYPFLLLGAAVAIAPTVAALIALRRLTVLRLMFWSALAGAIAMAAWLPIQGMLRPPHPGEAGGLMLGFFNIAFAAIYSFFNTGLFVLLAGLWRWPAVRDGRVAA